MVKSAAEPTVIEKIEESLASAEAAIADEAKSKRRGGGKLSRSETVTVRLDPQLNYLCELAARAQRRTKSSFIEWAIENALESVGIPGEKINAAGDLFTIAMRKPELWDVDEPDRLVSLAYQAPSLLTHEEQVIWKLIVTSGYFWKGHYEDDVDEELWVWDIGRRYNLMMDRVRQHWEEITRVASGDEPRSEYFALVPRLVRGKPVGRPKVAAFDDLEDDTDVPF